MLRIWSFIGFIFKFLWSLCRHGLGQTNGQQEQL